MTENARPTLPPPENHEASLEQQRLTLALAKHAEPHVRLIAHISERQLAMSEQISEMVRAQGELLSLVRDLKPLVEQIPSVNERLEQLVQEQEQVESRIEELEQRPPFTNGSSSPY